MMHHPARTTIPWSPPIFRWAGSKRQLLPTLMRAVPNEFTRYIEPFAGSACLFFALKPASAVLGDVNEHLLHAYSVIRDHPRLVARKVAEHPRTSNAYYAVRSLDPGSLSDLDRAARFVYLNRFCFNGVYRTNRQGQFNVPRGEHMGGIPSESAFYRCAVALRQCQFRTLDFENTLADIRPGDFVYLDPPYSNSTRKTYGEYGYGVFAPIDHKRLVRLLTNISDIGASFLLSYCPDPDLMSRLPKSWYVDQIDVRRNVAGFVSHRRIAAELLISNFMHNAICQKS